jgi:hypothetical protein
MVIYGNNKRLSFVHQNLERTVSDKRPPSKDGWIIQGSVEKSNLADTSSVIKIKLMFSKQKLGYLTHKALDHQ